MKKKPRNASIVALSDLEVIVIRKDNFDVITKYYSLEFVERKKYLCYHFPGVNLDADDRRLFQFLDQFTPAEYRKNKLLTVQGAAGRLVYFVVQGFCQVVRRCAFKAEGQGETVHRKINLCDAGPGSIVGEEVLFRSGEEAVYEYDVVVLSASLEVYVFEKMSNYQDMKDTPILLQIQQLFKEKK